MNKIYRANKVSWNKYCLITKKHKL